jgi:uncharacterized protein YpuA (DUF1002 family)
MYKNMTMIENGSKMLTIAFIAPFSATGTGALA